MISILYYHFFSFIDPSDGPWLDQDKPELNVTIKYFVNRPMFYNESIVIKSHNKILYRGRLVTISMKSAIRGLLLERFVNYNKITY